jgi:GT2 family glycosyltransferase
MGKKKKQDNPLCAIGIVVKDRWNLTHQTLMSLYFSAQKKSSYDVYIIDNGSSKDTISQLKAFVKSGLLPVKNLIVLPEEIEMSKAWNLFLCMAEDYPYRLKLDNDIVFQNSIPAVPAKPNPLYSPMADSALGGAPISGAIIKGAGAALYLAMRRKMKQEYREVMTSKFLDHMIGFSKDFEVGLLSLVPVSPAQTFSAMAQEIVGRTIGGRPYLFGACMMITKPAFEQLGYFDERLARRIDIEYSQRAIRNGINIGYHPSYCCTHIGADQSTEPSEVREARYAAAIAISQKELPIKCHADSIWVAAQKKIIAASKKDTILSFN